VSGEARAQQKDEHRKDQRQKLIARLRDEGAEDLAEPIEACGLPVMLTCTCCGQNKETHTHCQKRWCPVCAPMLSAKRFTRWAHAIGKLQWPLFITLTIPNSEDPECLRHLKDAWAKFRRRKIIASRVSGGVATFEVTNKGEGWHPHIHAVVDCEWLSVHVPPPLRWETKAVKKQKGEHAQKELSTAWAEQIGNPIGVVYVRRVYGTGVVQEILKYAVKSSDLIESPDPIAPMLRVLRQTRTLSGFGTLHPLPSPDEEEPMIVACDSCGAEKSFMPDELVKFFAPINIPGMQGRTLTPTKHQ